MFDRVMDAAQLRLNTFQEANTDGHLDQEARTVVLYVCGATAVGTVLDRTFNGQVGDGLYSAVVNAAMTFISWQLWSYMLWLLGSKTLDGRGDLGGMRRSMAYAMTPLALLAFVFLPVIGRTLLIVGMVWSMALAVVAVRQSLRFSTSQAVTTVIFGWLTSAVIVGVAWLVLRIPVAIVTGFLQR